MLILDVVEGEKCADALAAVGLISTTSQGGAGRAAESDWSPAARFDAVRIWQDIDEADLKTGINPGLRYAQTVAELVYAAWQAAEQRTASTGSPTAARGTQPPLVIMIVDLSKGGPLGETQGLGPGEDVYDWMAIQHREGKDLAAIRAGLEALAEKCGRRWLPTVTISYPDQPKPLEQRPLENGSAPLIANFEWHEKEIIKKAADGVTEIKETKKICSRISVSDIRNRVLEITGGWPCRVASPGAKQPLLFVDEGGQERMRWFTGSESFTAWLHDLGLLKFLPKLDGEMSNFVTMTNLYHDCGENTIQAGQYVAVEARPHHPLMKRHYYLWREVKDYQADGAYLLKLLKFFDNAKAAKDRALIAAAFLTPGWGGPYGKRPAFAITAGDRGWGKSTLAKAIATVWGGAMSVDVTQRGIDQIIERMLSPDALLQRVAMLDNMKGVLSNATIEKLITEEVINGKRMYTGDARRPNNLTWIITANGLRLSRDMAQRSFFIELVKPIPRAEWDKGLYRMLCDEASFVVADCIAVLKQHHQTSTLGDRWVLWVEDVLGAAISHPLISSWIRDGGRADAAEAVDVGAVIAANQLIRDDSDEDKEEAGLLMRGLLAWICVDEKLVYFCRQQPLLAEEERVYLGAAKGWLVMALPTKPAIVSSEKMRTYWQRVMGKRMNAKQIKHILREHRESGRMTAFSEPTHTRDGNVYEVGLEVLREHVLYVREAVMAGRIDSVLPPSGGGAVADVGVEGDGDEAR